MKSRLPPSTSTSTTGSAVGSESEGMFDNSVIASMLGFGGGGVGSAAPNYIVANPTWDWTDAWPKTDTVEQRGDPRTGGYKIHATPQGGLEADGTIWGEEGSGSIGDLKYSGSNRYGTVENRAGLYGEDGERRIGHHHQYSARKVTGQASYGGLNAGFEGNGPNVSADMNVGEDGAAVGLQGTLADAAVTLDNIGTSSHDQLGRFGLSEGVGAAGRLHWGDKDKDGYHEFGLGADLGPFSFDVKSEDPLRDLMGPLGGIADLAGVSFADNKGNNNWTHAAWDTASGLAENIDPSVIAGPLMAPVEGLSNAWDTVSGFAENLDPSVIAGPLVAPLSRLWD